MNRPSDGLYHQQQAILRNASSDSSGLVESPEDVLTTAKKCKTSLSAFDWPDSGYFSQQYGFYHHRHILLLYYLLQLRSSKRRHMRRLAGANCCEQAAFQLPRVAWGSLKEPRGA